MSADLSAILLRVGQQTVPLANPAALGPAIEAQNASARIPNLPDTLNPGMIDPAKASAFAAGLPRQGADTLARLQGHELLINGHDLGIGAAEPTRAEAFAEPFTLVIEDVQGRNVIAHTSVPADPALAKSRATEAEARLRDAEKAVQQAQAARTGGTALGGALRRRAAVAFAWRLNAQAWKKAAPNDPAAATALDAAQKAARDYMRPSGGLI
jgi:hypothetical protein